MISAKQLTRQRNHQNYISIICFPLLFMLAANVWAGSESLRPDGDPTPDHMSIQNTSRYGATNDDNDATYIYVSDPGSEKLSIADNTSIPGTATIDSVVIEYRAKKDFGAGSAKLRARIFRGAVKYCDSEEWTLSASWANHRFQKFDKAPTTAGTCTDNWTKALIDSLDVQIIIVQAGDEPKVAELWAHVYWTAAGTGSKSGRRRKQTLISMVNMNGELTRENI